MVIEQDTVNALIGGLFTGMGWVLKTLYSSLKDLQQADSKLADKVQNIELLVAGKYVTREDFINFNNAIFKKLDDIEERKDELSRQLGALFLKLDKLADR